MLKQDEIPRKYICLVTVRIKIPKSLLSTSAKFTYPKLWILVTDPKSENCFYPYYNNKKILNSPYSHDLQFWMVNLRTPLLVIIYDMRFLVFSVALSPFTVNFMAQIL